MEQTNSKQFINDLLKVCQASEAGKEDTSADFSVVFENFSRFLSCRYWNGLTNLFS